LLEEVLEAAETFIATCYEGERLSDDKGSGITAIEKTRLDELKGRVDDVLVLREPFIRTSPRPPRRPPPERQQLPQQLRSPANPGHRTP